MNVCSPHRRPLTQQRWLNGVSPPTSRCTANDTSLQTNGDMLPSCWAFRQQHRQQQQQQQQHHQRHRQRQQQQQRRGRQLSTNGRPSDPGRLFLFQTTTV